MAYAYIYLLKPLFSVTSNQDIYKIGKTSRINYKRFNEYPEGSILLLQSSCKNCDTMEKNLLKIFDEKFIKRTEYGREYFEGDITLMRDIVNEEIRNEKIDRSTEGRIPKEVQNNVESKAETSESEKGFSAVPNHQNKYKCSECDSSYDDKYSITEENTRTQKSPKYSCQPCDYKCNKKNEWGRHISTLKHINRTQNIIDNQFECKLCEFSCKKESEWSRHVQTKKHKTRSNKIETILSITCDICNKEYKSKTSLWYHKKTCIPLLENTIIKETIQDENIKKNDDDAATLNTNNLVIELLKQNNELQKQIIEMAKEPKIVKYNNTNNQCTNNNDALDIYNYIY